MTRTVEATGLRRFALGSFEAGSGERFAGVVIDDRVTPLGGLGLDTGLAIADLLADWTDAFAHLSQAVQAGRADAGRPVAELRVLAPLPSPAQLFCTGANYAKHVIQMMLATNSQPALATLDETGRRRFAEEFVARQARESDPYIFMKTITSICGPYDEVDLPAFSTSIDWELELAAVFGRTAHLETRDSAMSAVAGYIAVNDVTARDKVRRTDAGSIGADWVAGKGAPGFLPTGPYFVPAAFVPDPYDLELRLSVNGETMQHARTGEMTFDIARQIEFLTRFAKVLPGDILCTGTPEGNAIATGAFLKDGDVVEAGITGLGVQRTVFRARRP